VALTVFPGVVKQRRGVVEWRRGVVTQEIVQLTREIRPVRRGNLDNSGVP
jgi:hypothetical protein